MVVKRISALKARHNLGQLLNEVSLRGDIYIIERAGKPLAALVALDHLAQLALRHEEEPEEATDLQAS